MPLRSTYGHQTLTDLNDYLGPSQACIKPVEGKVGPDAAELEAEKAGSAAVSLAFIAACNLGQDCQLRPKDAVAIQLCHSRASGCSFGVTFASTADHSGIAVASPQTEIAIDRDGSYYESSGAHAPSANSTALRARTKLEAAEISLNDCLACSGCVTSAESVLITMQSHQEVRKVVEENKVSFNELFQCT